MSNPTNDIFEHIFNEEDFNVFEIDSFLHEYTRKDKINELLYTIGYTDREFGDYEREHNLPAGILEFCILIHDPISVALQKTSAKAMSGKISKEEILKQTSLQISAFRQLSLKYPKGMKFLNRYSEQMLRNDKSKIYLNGMAKQDVCTIVLVCIAGVFLAAGVAIAVVAVAVAVAAHAEVGYNVRYLSNIKSDGPPDSTTDGE